MNTLFLGVRTLHILLAATWFGTAVVMALFVMPAIGQTGPDGGKVVAALIKRGFIPFIASIGGLTVVTGLYLYWVFMANPGFAASMGGRVLGAGGILGIAAAAIAGSVVGKNMKGAVALMQEAAAQTDAAKRAPLIERAGQLRQKATMGARIVVALLTVTITLMALGHYV